MFPVDTGNGRVTDWRYAVIVGGARDGERVRVVGPEMYEPIRPTCRYVSEHEPLSVQSIPMRRYRLYYWADRRECDGLRYVADEFVEGLGVK